MNKPNSTQPLVTVYIPTFNRAELLKRAVDSVLNQKYKNIELIVVDDNSTDGTHDYLAEMAKLDPRFKYFINKKNSGACVSRNKAIYAAKGDFVTGLDDDDYFLPNRISSFVNKAKLLEKNCVALYSHVYFKKNNTEELIKSKRVKSCDHNMLLNGNWIGNQIFTKRSYLNAINGFDETMPAWQDLECWYRLLSFHNSKAVLVPDYTYIVDVSHAHERISLKKSTSILEAYDIFTKKFNLSNRDRAILKLHLDPYITDSVSSISILYGLIEQPDLANFKRAMALFKSKLKKSINSKLK